jgi:nucleoside-diphosphate-sugar epimerase
MNSVPRLLVIGGNGFIGRHIVTHALQRGWSVTSTGISPTAEQADDHPRLIRRVADTTDSASLAALVADTPFSYVVNCGGYIDHTLYFKGGKKLFDAHFGAACYLPELLDRDALKAFVNIGSSDEYGNQPSPQRECDREAPISPYACGKTAATHFLQMLARTESFPAISLRLFLTYGPGQDDRRFLPQIIRNCLADVAFPVSQGEQLRDFCYVADTVDAVFKALETPAALGEVINIGSGAPVTIRSVIEHVRAVIGKGDPRYGEIAYRPGENMSLYPDTSKARTLLDWVPQTSLEDGIQNTIQALS